MNYSGLIDPNTNNQRYSE